MFSDDLDAEARHVRVQHLDILNHFFRGTDPHTGQQTFWPYEFGIIPIETISAIYEHFLKAAGEQEKKDAGAFYTPRFLAELVLDQALAGVNDLLGKRFLDPACGSGIFLVGLFNRLAEEWMRANPGAGYDDKLKGLTGILETNLYGNDKNRTACRIAAFSLYLALLDQLAPPDIRRVLKKVKVLPRLVADKPGMSGRIHSRTFSTLRPTCRRWSISSSVIRRGRKPIRSRSTGVSRVVFLFRRSNLRRVLSGRRQPALPRRARFISFCHTDSCSITGIQQSIFRRNGFKETPSN